MSRKTYLLVPGAWHGGWCWEKIVPRLRSAGHEAITPDLPGCDADGPSTAKVTLEGWTRWLCALMEGLHEPVILVGHSRGGILISQVAERVPDRVLGLVYVAGFLMRSGESALSALREDGTSKLLRNVSLSADRSNWALTVGAAREMFYGECSTEEARLAISRAGVEPARPLMTPLRISDERFGRVSRSYIECLRDGAVPLALQRKMHARLPCRRVVSIDTDHAPFLSAPDALTARLLEVTVP